jgi:hypothetical protein
LTEAVTVICAVWSRQQDKEALLRGHMANLDRQSLPHQRVYVFDEGDPPPDWLTGAAVCVRDPLTIYQAWNVALSLVRTPFVMNLNLDDRLMTDGMAVLLDAIVSDPAIHLVGGDWKITPTAEATDATDRSYPLDALAPTAGWPPDPNVVARLGSGDGLVRTFGPATLWRMMAHRNLPRYPYRFQDGLLVKVIGDAVWWSVLAQDPQKKLVRVPAVIGHYRTWPSHQAEFRHSDVEEFAKGPVLLI